MAQDIKNFRERQVSSQKTEHEKERAKKFVRKGQVGDWKNHFKVAFNERCDAWIAGNLEGMDICFQFD